MKTFKEWFDTVEDQEVRSKILQNIRPERLNYREVSLFEALLCAFSWSSSPEGFEYWNELADSFVTDEDLKRK